jgi:hypothetical protein
LALDHPLSLGHLGRDLGVGRRRRVFGSGFGVPSVGLDPSDDLTDLSQEPNVLALDL